MNAIKVLAGGALALGVLAGCGPAKPELHVYTWSDYIDAEVIAQFEEKQGCRVIVDTFDSNEAMFAKLQAEIDGMSIPYQKGLATSVRVDAVNGKTFVCTGSSDISSFRLDFNGDVGVLTYVTSRGEKQLTFGIGKNVACILDEPQYSGELINHPNGKGYRSYCSGAWTNATTFALKVQVVDDYLGNMTMTFDLDSNPSLTVTKTAEWFLDEYKMSNVSYRMQ